VFNEFSQKSKPNFVEYLQKGWFVNMAVAIDFTSSNMNKATGRSRHHIEDNKQNEYEVAISQVGKILENYSHKQFFSGYGFGGKPNHGVYHKKDQVEHCFTLTGTGSPCVKGLRNFLHSY
jgi:hypothetical protein